MLTVKKAKRMIVWMAGRCGRPVAAAEFLSVMVLGPLNAIVGVVKTTRACVLRRLMNL
jgi:hypothetical protein